MHFLLMLSSIAFYPLLMNSENGLTILLIVIIAPLMIFTKQYTRNKELNVSPYTNGQTFIMATEDLRERFLRKNIEKQKVRILEQITNNTIFVDGIPHVNIEKSGIEEYDIIAMENAFRSLLAMNGVKYIFKRGFHWRTWRQIDYKGNKTIVCYKCNGVAHTTCRNCHSGGYWVIEKTPPPCPYEIMSIPNDRKLCAIQFSEYADSRSVCPTLINVSDLLITCDNPIETEWKITSKYINRKSEAVLNIICGGQEFCEILTLYTISQNSILFRIVNSTNHIIYSRMMKSGHNNYACIRNCGMFDKKTKMVTKNEKPVIFNLLGSVSFKNKREYNTGTLRSSLINNFKSNLKSMRTTLLPSEGIEYYKYLYTQEKTTDPFLHSTKSVTKTLCKKIEDKYKQDDIGDTMED